MIPHEFMALELFEVDESESLVRRVLRAHGEFDLSDFEIDTYQIHPGYEVKSFQFSADRKIQGREIRTAIEPITQEAENEGYSSMLFTALYEAVLNAHQHGNNNNSSKNVTIAYKFDSNSAEVAVIDQGGKLHPEFISFVLRHREGKHIDKFIDWYEFTGQEKPSTNLGTGTSYIHTYAHNVQYFKSEDNGLVIHLTRFKNQENEELVN